MNGLNHPGKRKEASLPKRSFANPLSYGRDRLTSSLTLSSYLFTFHKSPSSSNINNALSSMMLRISRLQGMTFRLRLSEVRSLRRNSDDVRRIHALSWVCIMLAMASLTPPVCSQPQQSLPAGLPQYDLDILLDVAAHHVAVRQTVTWTNTTQVAARELVFNAHSHYSIPKTIRDVVTLSKMVELLRMAPKEALSFDGPALEVDEVTFQGKWDTLRPGTPLEFYFPKDNETALHIPLPAEVQPGASVTVELKFHLKLPPRKGRWGQWDGITTLAQWLPVVAVYDANGWQPTPFIPWHQPYFNEAGIYTVKVRLPCDQKLAASGCVRKETRTDDEWRDVEFEPICVRDF